MFPLMLAAALAQASASGSGGTTQSSGPLREIVYKFSDSETSEYSTDQAQQNQDSSSGQVLSTSTGLNAPPSSSTRVGGYYGTITVDVLQVEASSGFMKVEVHEQTSAENGKNPFDVVFIVRPDGGMAKLSGTDDPDIDALVPYFGTSYFADHTLAQGESWTNDSTFDAGKADEMQLETTSTVVGSNGNNVSIKSVTSQKNLKRGSWKMETTLLYNAAKLVPINLDVIATRRGGGDTATAEQVSHYHFDRVSDTLDHS